MKSGSKKEKAFALRIKGYSYNEINSKLGIPKSTLSNWFSGLILSQKARKRIDGRVHRGVLNGLVKRNKKQTHLAWQRARTIQKEAGKSIKKLSQRELLLIGIALYWGEGYKKLVVKNGRTIPTHSISFTNTDPAMIKLFVLFLIDIVKIPKSKIVAYIRIFKHLNENETLKYWINVTELPKENFKKPSYTVSSSSKGKRPYNRLPYGILQIRVADTQNFHKVIGWIEGMKSCIMRQ